MFIAGTGAGATGKTTVLEAVAKQLDLPFMPSVVRAFYANKGMPEGERALMGKPIEERFAFQLELFHHYCASVKSFAENNPKGFVTDRAPYDHVGYLINYAPELVNLETLRDVLEKAHDCADLFDFIFHFPYPVSWSNENDGDSFRVIPAGKNFIIESILYTVSWKNQLKDFDYIEIPDLSIEERTSFILNLIS